MAVVVVVDLLADKAGSAAANPIPFVIIVICSEETRAAASDSRAMFIIVIGKPQERRTGCDALSHSVFLLTIEAYTDQQLLSIEKDQIVAWRVQIDSYTDLDTDTEGTLGAYVLEMFNSPYP